MHFIPEIPWMPTKELISAAWRGDQVPDTQQHGSAHINWEFLICTALLM